MPTLNLVQFQYVILDNPIVIFFFSLLFYLPYICQNYTLSAIDLP